MNSNLGSRQLQILQYIDSFPEKEATKKQIVSRFRRFCYYNASKHIGDVLSRMVKRKLLSRPKRATYKIDRYTAARVIVERGDKNQANLFS